MSGCPGKWRLEAVKMAAVSAVVLALYVVFLGFLPGGVFWSPDEGGRFLMLREWVRGSSPGDDPEYRGRHSDPDFEFYPVAHQAHIYPQKASADSPRFGWPLWFVAVSAPFYRLFGTAGLQVLPLAGGVLCAMVAGIVAEKTKKGSGATAIALTGLATPVAFYSMLFWEHTLSAVLCMGAVGSGLAAWHGGGWRRIAWSAAGLVMFIMATAMRPEMLVAGAAVPAVAVLCIAAPNGGGGFRGSDLRTTAVAVAVMLLAYIVGILVTDMAIRGAHQTGLSPFRGWQLERVLTGLAGMTGDSGFAASFANHVRGIMVNNPIRSGLPLSEGWTLIAAVGLLICMAARLFPGSKRAYAWTAGAVLVGTAALVALVDGDRYRAVHSFFLPAPWLVIACLGTHHDAARSRGAGCSPAAFLERFAWVYLALFILATFATGKPAGGLEWGSRYALAGYPIFAISASVSMRDLFSGNAGRSRTLVIVVAALLIAESALFTARGMDELRKSKKELTFAAQAILRCDAPAVTDLWWLPAALAPVFAEKEMHLIPGKAATGRWLDAGCGGSHFLCVTDRRLDTALFLDEAGVTLIDETLTPAFVLRKFSVKKQ